MPTCPSCRHHFRVLEDEDDGQHGCPACGYHPNQDTNQEDDMRDFEGALAAYVAAVQGRVNQYYQKFATLTPSTVLTQRGPKFVRIIVQDAQPSRSASAHSFVRIADGDILFCAGWNGPSRKPSAVRGNIYDEGNGLPALAPAPSYHLRYLR